VTETRSVRDQDATGFTRHLDTLLRQLPDAVCAVFVDSEGETVDLSSRMDAFETRIVGAELAILLASVRASQARLHHGEALELRVEGNERSFIARTVGEGYDLVVLVRSSTISARVAEMTAATAIALLVEAGLKPPPSYATLRSVEQRESRSGMPVPSAFDESGVRRRVEAVLGHRQDGAEVKFLVRVDDGEELVIAREQTTGRWRRV
jgi:predicted regulator of Ras-like GTPase activity (Roadblock/LC7/MglB family)